MGRSCADSLGCRCSSGVAKRSDAWRFWTISLQQYASMKVRIHRSQASMLTAIFASSAAILLDGAQMRATAPAKRSPG
eukprot:3144417-Pleurochrysis_carterae.AAC.1